MNDEWLGLDVRAWLKETAAEPACASQSTDAVMARVANAGQRGPRWPWPSVLIPVPALAPATSRPAPAWRFTMFSAVKLVAAAAVVALFGGLLLTSSLTMPPDEELVPAAVTTSPSPSPEAAPLSESEPTPEPDAGPVADTELVPGMTLYTQEVEPGVLLVTSDDPDVAARLTDGSATIVAGQDGSIWHLAPSTLHRLGDAGSVRWEREWRPSDVEDQSPSRPAVDIGKDGTVWIGPDQRIASYDGETWSYHRKRPGDWAPGYPQTSGIGMTSDGTVVAVRGDRDEDETEVIRYGDGSWQPVTTVVGTPAAFAVHGDDIWLATIDRSPASLRNPLTLRHFAGGEWQDVALPEIAQPVWPPDEDWHGYVGGIREMLAGPDGMLWMEVCVLPPPGVLLWGWCAPHIVRVDGTDWRWFTVADDPDQDFVTGTEPIAPVGRNRPQIGWAALRDMYVALRDMYVASDGGLWFTLGTDYSCGGLAEFDGVEWTNHFLDGYCVQSMDITPDGDIWLVAGELRGPNEWGRWKSRDHHTYVITAEAIASAE